MPSNFYLDTISKDSQFHSLSPISDPLLLEPNFRAIIETIIADAATQRTTLIILQTYRSQELQELYFEQGATQLKTVGVHHYGLACDLGIEIGGQINWKADYSVLGRLADKHGVIWGGDWGTPNRSHSFRDYDHIQRIAVADQNKLFSGAWYPDANYQLPPIVSPTPTPSAQPLQLGSQGPAVVTLQIDLTNLGYPLNVDGDFGAQTEAAIKSLQKKYNMVVDGIVGTMTENIIDIALKNIP